MQEKEFFGDLGLDPLVLVLVFLALTLFGLAFNWMVDRMGPRARGRRAVLVGLCFVASGLPMIVGEWLRFDKRSQAEDQDLALDILDELDRRVDHAES